MKIATMVLALFLFSPMGVYGNIDDSNSSAPSSKLDGNQAQKEHKNGGQNANNNNKSSEQLFVLEKDKVPTPKTDKQPDQKNTNESKNSTENGAMTYATVILSIATIALAFFTAGLWRATAKMRGDTERLVKIQERAYVYQIGSCKGYNFESIIINYGRTPAEITGICVEICPADSLPTSPNYSNKVPYWAYPFLAPTLRDTSYRKDKSIEGVNDPIVYGRVWYKDIFEMEHSSGFIYKVTTDGRIFAVMASPEYTKCT